MKEKGAVLVVGADSDIGAALIKRLSGDIVAHYFGFEEKLDALKAKNRNIIPVFGDLSSVEEIELFLARLSEVGMTISKIVHLPSSPAAAKRLTKFDAAQFQREINIQVTSAAMIWKALLPAMAKEKYGRVAVALTAYCIGVPPKYLTAYVSAKYALMGLMKSAAVEYAGKGITVNAVAPSMTETKFLSTLPDFEIEANAKSNPMGRNAAPEDIAPVLEMLLGDDIGFMTGAILPVSGGTAFF